MFERPHHRRIAALLEQLDAGLLASCACWFAGGTAIALRYGEFRESVDVDFAVSAPDGYRTLRQLLTEGEGIRPLARPGAALQAVRELRADQYGIRTALRAVDVDVKFEIVFEARVQFDRPGPTDSVCGIASLRAVDLATTKLLANCDRWADDSVYSRDLIDLAMMSLGRAQLAEAMAKASRAYGQAVERDLRRAIQRLQERRGRLAECVDALGVTVPHAVVWKCIRALHQRSLAAPT